MFVIFDVKSRGRLAVKENFTLCMLVALSFIAINGLTNLVSPQEAPFLPWILKFFLLNPIEVGFAKFFLNNREGKTSFMDLFHGFLGYGYLNVVKIMFLRDLKVILLACILAIPASFIMAASMLSPIFMLLIFVIFMPVVALTIEHSMIPFLIADDCGMRSIDVFVKTKEMIRYNKMQILLFGLSFIGWAVLTVLSFGIIGIYLTAFSYAAMAEIYIDLC